MKFTESKIIVGPRTMPDVYRVVDTSGRYHGFYSAAEANRVFPGAFDTHPDYDDTDAS